MSNIEIINNYYKLLNSYQLANLFGSLKANNHLNSTLESLQLSFISGVSKQNAYFLNKIENAINDLEFLSYMKDEIDLPEGRVNKLSLNYLLRFEYYSDFFDKLSTLYDVTNDINYNILLKEFKTNVCRTNVNFKGRLKLMMDNYIK